MPGRAESLRRRQVAAEVLRQHPVHSQAELREHLAARGFRVTQSSVSRDLQEIGAVRVDGRYLPLDDVAGSEHVTAGLAEVVPFMTEAAPAGPYVLVVKTLAGLAGSVALALDQSGWPEVVGTVAGDDTFFVATAGRRQQARVQARLAGLRRETTHG